MSDLIKLIKEVMNLTSDVSVLKNDIGKLNSKVEENRERIIKLEQREELIIEKMKNTAMEVLVKIQDQGKEFPFISKTKK
ncbi:MAG: hypothetical protein PVH88_14350 [Ignavibacteria bacterium]|jgi:hypothetical protein